MELAILTEGTGGASKLNAEVSLTARPFRLGHAILRTKDKDNASGISWNC
jgi:hypothetical protein